MPSSVGSINNSRQDTVLDEICWAKRISKRTSANEYDKNYGPKPNGTEAKREYSPFQHSVRHTANPHICIQDLPSRQTRTCPHRYIVVIRVTEGHHVDPDECLAG